MPAHRDTKDQQQNAHQTGPDRGGGAGEGRDEIIHINEQGMPDEQDAVQQPG